MIITKTQRINNNGYQTIIGVLNSEKFNILIKKIEFYCLKDIEVNLYVVPEEFVGNNTEMIERTKSNVDEFDYDLIVYDKPVLLKQTYAIKNFILNRDKNLIDEKDEFILKTNECLLIRAKILKQNEWSDIALNIICDKYND